MSWPDDRLPPHPQALPGNNSGANGMKAGDPFVYALSPKKGWVDEFLQDGGAFVTWDDGSHDTINWNHIDPIG